MLPLLFKYFKNVSRQILWLSVITFSSIGLPYWHRARRDITQSRYTMYFQNDHVK